jgi:hypothetical protein
MMAPSLPFATSVDNRSSPGVRAVFSSSVSKEIEELTSANSLPPVLTLWYDENVISEDYKKFSGLLQGVPTGPFTKWLGDSTPREPVPTVRFLPVDSGS